MTWKPKFFRSSFLPRTEIKKGTFLKMQLSSKASSVALKSFTNARSPYWHSSFQHLTYTLAKLPGTNAIVTVTLSLVPLLTTCYLVLVHYCLVCITQPLSATASGAAALPSTLLLRECGCEVVLLCSSSSLPVSFFLLGKTSGQRYPPRVLGSPGRGLGEEGSYRGGKSHAGGMQE